MPALEQRRLLPVVRCYLSCSPQEEQLTDKIAAFDVRRLLIVELKHVISVIKGYLQHV